MDPSTPEATTRILFKTVTRFCEERSMSRATFYREVKAGRLCPVKRGTRTLVPAAEADRYDSSLPNMAAVTIKRIATSGGPAVTR